MATVRINRGRDVSMPGMRITIDGKTYELLKGTWIDLDLADGVYKVDVECGGFTSCSFVEVPRDKEIFIKSRIPIAFHVISLVIVLISLALYLFDLCPIVVFAVILLVCCTCMLSLSLINKNDYFKIVK